MNNPFLTTHNDGENFFHTHECRATDQISECREVPDSECQVPTRRRMPSGIREHGIGSAGKALGFHPVYATRTPLASQGISCGTRH
jgi:hypothetical protein